MVLIFFPDYIDNPRGKKQPQRSSLGLNYGPITSSMDDKIGGRRPRRPNFTQGEMKVIISQRGKIRFIFNISRKQP